MTRWKMEEQEEKGRSERQLLCEQKYVLTAGGSLFRNEAESPPLPLAWDPLLCLSCLGRLAWREL